MAFDPLGAIGTGLNFVGNWLDREEKENQAEANRVLQKQIADRNFQLQEDFAKHGIRWKAEDARQAGISPLFALGASTSSFSPVSIGELPSPTGSGLGAGLASMGQDLSSVINSTRTAPEREDAFIKTVKDLQVTKLGLENDLLASQIAKIRARANPALPTGGEEGLTIPEKKLDDRTSMIVGGTKVLTDPGTSDAKAFEDRYGDESLVSKIIGNYIAYRDYLHNVQSEKFLAKAARGIGYKELPSWARKLRERLKSVQ